MSSKSVRNFRVMLLTDRQTNKQTPAKNITSLSEVINKTGALGENRMETADMCVIIQTRFCLFIAMVVVGRLCISTNDHPEREWST